MDRVTPEHEVTIDADGYTQAQVDRIIVTARARGLHVSGTNRWLLIRAPSRRSAASRPVDRRRAFGNSTTVPVVFRLKREYGGHVIALFASVDADGTCRSFTHAGQWGRDLYPDTINQSRPARSEEYEAIMRELESPPHNYRLHVMKRLVIPPGAPR